MMTQLVDLERRVDTLQAQLAASVAAGSAISGKTGNGSFSMGQNYKHKFVMINLEFMGWFEDRKQVATQGIFKP